MDMDIMEGMEIMLWGVLLEVGWVKGGGESVEVLFEP